jgi:hypothetical protein
MMQEDKFLHTYEDVIVENSNEWNAHSIYVLKDASYYILSIRETLHNK